MHAVVEAACLVSWAQVDNVHLMAKVLEYFGCTARLPNPSMHCGRRRRRKLEAFHAARNTVKNTYV